MAESSEKHTKKPRGPGRRFQPGQSGNPGGRPKGYAGLAAAVREKVGDDGGKLIDALFMLAKGTPNERKAFFGEPVKMTAKDRREAINDILDRGWGKAPQTVDFGDETKEAMRVMFGGRYKPTA